MRLMIAFVLSALAALPLAADPAQIRPVSRATAMDQLVDASVALPVRDISADVRPIARDEIFPRMRWDHRGERGYGCRAGTGEALKSGPANLSCAARIMAVTVQRDGVIHARQPRWSGVSADWGPMRSPSKRADMANWLKKQSYCKSLKSLRPSARPSN